MSGPDTPPSEKTEKKRLSRRMYVSLLAASVIGTAGCGDLTGSQTDDTTAQPSTTATTTPQEATQASTPAPANTPADETPTSEETATATPTDGDDTDGSAANWMFHHGPDSSGVSDSEMLINGLQKEWEFNDGGVIHGMPAPVGDSVYVGNTNGTFYALDRSDGSLNWEYETEDSIHTAPAVSEPLVYFGNDIGKLYAIDIESGVPEWTLSDTGRRPIRSSPVIVDGTLYFGTHNGTLYAVDAETGDPTWTIETPGSIHGSPAVADGRVVVADDEGNLYGVDASDGTKQWRARNLGELRASPIVSGEYVFLGTGDRMFHAIQLRRGQMQWTNSLNEKVFIAMAADETAVYVTDTERRLFAYDKSDGTEIWKRPLVAGVPAPPTVVGDHLYVPYKNGHLVVINTDDGSARMRFRNTSRVNTAPAIADKTIYVGDFAGTVFALSEL